MKRRLWPSIGVVSLLLVLGAGATTMLAQDAFDSARWKALASHTGHDNPRHGMVTALRQRLRPGMSRQEVEALAGPADVQQGPTATYAIGASPFGIDYEYLKVEYDAQDRLARSFITRG